MDQEELLDDELPEPPHTYTVEVNGSFGTVMWTVSNHLWDVMPTTERHRAIDVTGKREIVCYFEERTKRLLRQVGKERIVPSSLSVESSLQKVEEDCDCFGRLYWQISQGLWDHLPVDQRDSLLELTMTLAHAFMRDVIVDRLLRWAIHRLEG